MPIFEEKSLGELPDEVIDAASRDIIKYIVGLVRIEASSRGQDAILLGSGTLVSIGKIYAILTAHHVVSILPLKGRLGLILTPNLHQHTIDTQGIYYLEIDRGSIDSDGPDLGAIILGQTIGSAIAAKKTFYNLDLRREKMLQNPPHHHDGFWFINGFIDEDTIEEPGRDGYTLIKKFHNLSGAGGPEKSILIGEHDYFEFPVSYGGRAVAPISFGGMSGGGLWQVPLIRNNQGEIVHKSPLLSGVVFYQVPTTETSCGVKCHGRQSIYNFAYEKIKNMTS
ncbi:MAG: hypothetical protein SRB2_04649 [Desulfobacteraceae bacterium Eth-SRB2]|nr:MAG: hypothetical protein SRB2_04649 [Desulfobacteraceae bacterium Eth-SRB2]